MLLILLLLKYAEHHLIEYCDAESFHNAIVLIRKSSDEEKHKYCEDVAHYMLEYCQGMALSESYIYSIVTNSMTVIHYQIEAPT